MTARYRPRRAPLGALAVAVLVWLAAAGCGASPSSSSSSSSNATARGHGSNPPALAHRTRATLILDFTPNAVHAGIYRALAAGYYRRENIDLRVVQPTSTEETLKLIDAGRAQFGLADGSDVAGLIARGGDAQAVMALVQRPLGGLIARAGEHVRSPADLQGRTVGVTGVPSDEAVLDTEVRHSGGDPRRVRMVDVGFDGARALVAKRIDAFTGFIPADGVGLQVSGHPITAFGLADNGGPPYPGLVAFTTRAEIARDPQLVRAFVAATAHGYRDTIADPERSLRDLLAANPTLPRRLTQASLRVYVGLFDLRGQARFGAFAQANLRAMSEWMTANRLIERPVAPTRYATSAFLP